MGLRHSVNIIPTLFDIFQHCLIYSRQAANARKHQTLRHIFETRCRCAKSLNVITYILGKPPMHEIKRYGCEICKAVHTHTNIHIHIHIHIYVFPHTHILGKLPMHEIKRYGCEICKAVAELHEQNIISQVLYVIC